MEFTERELDLLSDGIMRMIDDALRADTLVASASVRKALRDYMNELRELNTKICNYMEG